MSRFDNIFEFDSNLDGRELSVGIVMSRFNRPVCEGLLSSCVAELKRLGVADEDMAIPVWAGVLPLALGAGPLQPEAGCADRQPPAAPAFIGG